MRIVQLVGCALGHHRRSRHHTHHDGQVFRSTCAGCNRPMIKTLRGWTLETDAEAMTLPSRMTGKAKS